MSVRRQELPDEAFWPAGDAVRLWGKEGTWGSDDTHFFCALSYGWIQQGDPDRDCFTLGRVGAILAMYLEFFREDYCGLGGDCALFWDFGSLHQMPRSEAEGLLFRVALRYMQLVYAHWRVTVLRLEALPGGVRRLRDRRWPHLERYAGALKGSPPFREGGKFSKNGIL